MFMDEARLAGLVRHPNAVGVLDVGEDDDGPFLMMDFVEGIPLSRLIAEAAAADRPIPMQVAVRICEETARGLQAAHEVRSEAGVPLGLVHRDRLSAEHPDRVRWDGTRDRFWDRQGARQRQLHQRGRAEEYHGRPTPPEQLGFEDYDRRFDFFSLGVTLVPGF